jgi:hypothetical protein
MTNRNTATRVDRRNPSLQDKPAGQKEVQWADMGWVTTKLVGNHPDTIRKFRHRILLTHL